MDADDISDTLGMSLKDVQDLIKELDDTEKKKAKPAKSYKLGAEYIKFIRGGYGLNFVNETKLIINRLREKENDRGRNEKN
jgi:hypothetical protein